MDSRLRGNDMQIFNVIARADTPVAISTKEQGWMFGLEHKMNEEIATFPTVARNDILAGYCRTPSDYSFDLAQDRRNDMADEYY